jgi:hypothetical protein
MPLRLTFAATDLPRTGLNQMHLHLTSNATSQEETVARVLALGGTHLDVGQLPGEDHIVLVDPDANEFCVIEAGNNWLAGTSFLGEVAADGTREVGHFWAAALDWPLVWDEDGETAISPAWAGTDARVSRDTTTIVASEAGTDQAAGCPSSAAAQPEDDEVASVQATAAPDPSPPTNSPATAPAGVSPRHQIPSISRGAKVEAVTAKARPTVRATATSCAGSDISSGTTTAMAAATRNDATPPRR